MESVTYTLVILVAVIASSVCARISKIPLPLVQIAFGFVLELIFKFHVEIPPEVFIVLFIPPLLFLDGWRMPKKELFIDRKIILRLAFGLVFLTVLGVGFFVHWLIPTMPLPVAFALAASVSPTDPVAVSAIIANAPAPRRLMHILEGEALFNDASGLVCLRFAVAAMLTGAFSLSTALLQFAWLVIGGVIVGALLTIAAVRISYWLSKKTGEDIGAEIILSIVLPFIAYLLAEALRCSGILAAVSAGVAMSYMGQSFPVLARTRLQSYAVWDIIQFALNGFVFILLGLETTKIAASALHAPQFESRPFILLLFYAVAVFLSLVVVRFLWIFIAVRIVAWRKNWQRKKNANGETPPPEAPPNFQLIIAATLAGVRGAATLAGIMTLPLTLTNGSPFPSRNLAIFLAASVILFSILTATVGLPLALRGLKLPDDNPERAQASEARAQAAAAAIKALEEYQKHLKPDDSHGAQASMSVMDFYRKRIDALKETTKVAREPSNDAHTEKTLRLVGLRAERAAYYGMARRREVSDEIVRGLVREIDLMETRYLAS